MQYCPKCRTLLEGDTCPDCKGKTRVPEAGDPCLAVRMSGVFSEMYEDILRQEGIPCLAEGELGAGISSIIGTRLEVTDFFVPFARLEEAETLARELFGEDKQEGTSGTAEDGPAEDATDA
ncbi:MAG: DUF2007 domain-containing protein [Clostridiales bacterium]|nr:DUF2007 domain-containing protein [Clostridiales bacterium]